MRILVTDEGFVWNHKNPVLKEYKEEVLVVCLNGKAITDEYECFVSPYKSVSMLGMGSFSTDSRKYLALESVGAILNYEMDYGEDVLILADVNPETLYPYFVLKEHNKSNNLHLCAMSPFWFERRQLRAYKELLSDLKPLKSFLYLDGNKVIDSMKEDSNLRDCIRKTDDDYGNMLSTILRGIYDMDDGYRYFFDFGTMSYIPIDEGFSKVKQNAIGKKINNTKNDIEEKIELDTSLSVGTLGFIMPPSYPEDNDYVRNTVERMPARIDGKEVCNLLRDKRIALAKANGIKFDSEECPSIGACAGTCAKCDEELRYLQKELSKIPEANRIYPQFEVSNEVQL